MSRNASTLRVLALAPYPEGAPSTRVRVVQFQKGLAELGIEVTLRPFLEGDEYRSVRTRRPWALGHVLGATGRLVHALAGASSFDAVWIQRGVAPGLDLPVLRYLGSLGIPVVYDFDDAVFLPQDGGWSWVETLRRPAPTTLAYCRAASVVLAGNPYLADHARSGIGDRADHVRVLPSAVDARRLVPTAPPDPEVPVLGWVGSDSTLSYLEVLAPALSALARHVAYRLVVVGGRRRPNLPGVDLEVVPWSLADEAVQLQRMHVGLYPLADTPWSRGKCGFKALQYLSCGIPCVASPVGVLKDIVVPGRTGLLANSEEEWVGACASLLADGDARRRMGAAGRDLVLSEYSVEAVLPRLADALFQATGDGHD